MIYAKDSNQNLDRQVMVMDMNIFWRARTPNLGDVEVGKCNHRHGYGWEKRSVSTLRPPFSVNAAGSTCRASVLKCFVAPSFFYNEALNLIAFESH